MQIAIALSVHGCGNLLSRGHLLFQEGSGLGAHVRASLSKLLLELLAGTARAQGLWSKRFLPLADQHL